MICRHKRGAASDERDDMPAHAMSALALLPGPAVATATFLLDGLR